MLNQISNRPITVLMITLACCILGVLSWQRLPVQLLPELVFPEIQVNTFMANAYPEQLEREAVTLVEAEIAALDGVRKIESNLFGSTANTSVEFDQNTDMKFAVIKLQQKMNAIQVQLPEGARITIDRFDTSDLASFLMQINLRGTLDIDVLREIAERRIRSRLEQVDGVVDVSVGGGQRRTVDILIDPDRCEALNLPVVRVQETVNAYHQQRSHMGRVLAEGSWFDVTLQGRIDDIEDLRALLIDPSVPIRLDQVATVDYSTAERTELYRVDGKSSVGLFIRKDNISNMLTVSGAVLAAVAQLNEELKPEDIQLVIGANQAEMIQLAINQLEKHAVTGLLLALIVLFLFLRSIRFVSVLVLAIPVSLLITFNLMYAWNLSVNILSLCGLALAIGMLVDNGIVVLENVFRRFQRGDSGQEAAVTGTREMIRSIFAATITTVLVFLPVMFVENQARLFIRELALSVVFPLLVSLLVATTVIPLLAGRMLKGSHMQAFGGGRILEIYRVLLKTALRCRVHTIIFVALLFTISVVSGLAIILSQAPAPSSDQFDVYITAPRGATLDATDAIARRVESQIAAFPALQEYRTNVQPEEGHITVEFVPQAERIEQIELPQLKDQLTRQNRRLTGVTIGFEPPQSSRTGGSSGGGGGIGGMLDTPHGLRLRGYNMTTLRQLSEQLTQTLRTIPEVSQSSVQSDLRPGAPELQVHGDRNRLARAGMTMSDLMRGLAGTRAAGMNASTPYTTAQGDISIRFVVLGMDENQPEDIENINLRNINGQPVRMSEVANVRMDEGEGNITRYNQERQVRLSFDFTDEVKQSKTRLDIAEGQIRQLVDTFRLPEGFVLEQVDPENEQTIYYWIMGIGALLIYMFLAAQFESLLSPIVILGTIPTAIIGAFMALALTGTALSMGDGAPMALLGLIVLLGIVVNNGIILLDRIAVLRHQDGYRWQRAVLTAGQQRVRPIVMTSVTTMLGVFPLALKQGTDLELWPPFAITILGGLAVSTFSTLIFIPVLYVGLEQTKAWCKGIGTIGLATGTAISVALLAWMYTAYPSALYVGLVALPCWFIIQGFIYGIQKFAALRQARIHLTDRVERIQIRNLTKIYGLPDRFRRDWRKHNRRLAHLVEEGGLPWTRKQIFNRLIWLSALGLLLLFLHTFVDQALWIVVVSLLSMVWLFAGRDLWYAGRFVMGRPPAAHSTGSWRRWIPLKRFRPAAAPGVEQDKTSPLTFTRRGGIWCLIGLTAYLHLRLQLEGVTIATALIGLLLYQLHRIGRRIEQGRIDPERPTGRLRRIKQLIYTLVRKLPLIRPPVKEVTALNRVNLDIGRGMFGLLGPNGAGKTTLMRILVGVLNENRGSIFINGQKLAEARDTFHGAIGYLPQDFGLYEHMTPYAFLENHALINGIYEEEERRRLIDEVLHGVGLWDRRDDQIGTFSGGMKQRVGIAQTLLHLPQIIVVDEPTVGLDPRERIRFRNLLADLAKDRIVIFSTHIVEDISSTCHDLAVLFGGEVLYRGSPEVLQQRAEGQVFETVVSDDYFEQVRQQVHIVQHSKSDEGIRIRFVHDLSTEVWPEGLEAQQAAPTLEDAYVSLLRKAGAR